MSFDIDQAIAAANRAIATSQGRRLTDVELIVLRGAWDRDSYDQMAARNQYATSYISQDIAPKLWKLLSEALGEKVKKNNFKETLKRYWEETAGEDDSPVEETTWGGTTVTMAVGSRGLANPTIVGRETTLPYDTYVRRPDIEALCYDTLLQPGALVRIKAPKLTGKTSLVNYVLGQLTPQGFHTVNLSLRMADSQLHFNHLDNFLRWFCINIGEELGLESQLNQYWNAEWLGSKVSCTTYFEKYLLAQDDQPLVLCIDDVDLLFGHPTLSEDFFGLLRSWYEKARSRPLWKKLRLILAHSTEVYIRLDINQSPFNVGLPVELPEFTLDQAEQMAQVNGVRLGTDQVDALRTLVGGHPHLLEMAYVHCKRQPQEEFAEFLQKAPTQSGIFRNHLQREWLYLQQQPELEEAFKTVIQSSAPIPLEPIWAHHLQSVGLIQLTGNLAAPACELYRQYFLAHL